MHKSRKMFIKSVVRYSIDRLLNEAKENYKVHPKRTKRYIYLVLKFVQRYKVRLPREKSLQFCKKCFTYWVKGDTLTLKSNEKSNTKEYLCNSCGYKRRISYGKK